MISRKDLFTVALAAIAGYAGGLISARPRAADAAAGGPIRATRFELVDASGKTLGYWGFDHRYEGRLVIAFTGGKSGELAAFGLADQDGFLTLTGTDGKQRAALAVGDGRPSLVLGDEKWSSRVSLGSFGSDAPGPGEDNWGLIFRAPPGEKDLRHPVPAAIGYSRNASGLGWDGSAYIEDSTGKVWKAP
jgi:hypothetical protein